MDAGEFTQLLNTIQSSKSSTDKLAAEQRFIEFRNQTPSDNFI